MSSATYVLARFLDPEKLPPAIAVLNDCKRVKRWNAVEGHVNLVIKLDSLSDALPDGIKRLEGINEMFRYDILTDRDQANALDPRFCHAYVFIEVESEKADEVQKELQSMDSLIFVSKVRGGCDFVAIIRSESFNSIDNIVSDRIRVLDGIIRMKVDRVIDLKQI
jgi:DNA-binding Lrp family transcriptional regulator